MEKDVQEFLNSISAFLGEESFKPLLPAIGEAFRAGYEAGFLKGVVQRDTCEQVLKVYKGD